MSSTYLLLCAVFLSALFLFDWCILKSRVIAERSTWKAVGYLLILTLIFDNMIVGFGIVTYDPEKLLGIRLGYAPIEDFSYALAAPILMKSIRKYLGNA